MIAWNWLLFYSTVVPFFPQLVNPLQGFKRRNPKSYTQIPGQSVCKRYIRLKFDIKIDITPNITNQYLGGSIAGKANIY